MKSFKLNWLFIAPLAFMTTLSCSTDVEELEDLEELSTTSNLEERRAIPSGLENNVVIQWANLFVDLDQHAYGMRPTSTARSIAYINLAAYETAVENMDGYTSNTSRLEGLEIDKNEIPENLDVLIALNKCYSIVMSHFMINIDNNLDRNIGRLEASLSSELNDRISDRTIRSSEEWGEYVANQIIEYSQTDIAAEEQINEPQPTSYEPPVGDGFWTYSAEPERALFPYWGTVRTFVISSEETSSIPPSIEYSTDQNSDYYNEMLEVYETNNIAKEEQNDNLWIAEFWSDDIEGLMVSPPGRQVAIAEQLIKNNKLSTQESLVVLLKLGFSLNDAAVSSWADKYEHMVMRPSNYIHEFIDEDFETNLFKFIFWENPSFPGYPSGHSTFASAAAGVFIDSFGNGSFTDRTHEGRTEFLSDPRSYDSLSDMAEENAYSRIPLGVHIRIDCTEGYRLGYEIADAINDFDLSSEDQFVNNGRNGNNNDRNNNGGNNR